MTTLTFNPGLAYAEYNQRKAAYIIAALVAFTMSSYFVVGYLAGNLLFWTWNIAQSMNGGVGVGICFVMTAYQFILYSQGDVEGGKKATIVAVCVAVGFSLLSEVGQGMERDHVRMETKSIESPTYQAIVGKISAAASGPVAHPYSSQLQRAEMKLARCQKKVSDGEWTDCVESTARLTSVQNMIAQFYQQNQQNALTLTDKAKELEKDESNYHPLVNLIRNTLSSTGVVASFILSLILISFFEYAFHYLGRQLAAKRAELLANGFDVTRRNRKTPKALQRMQENNHPSPDQEEAAEAANTWNDELDKSGLASPADAALNQTAGPEQAQRIIERGQSVLHGRVDGSHASGESVLHGRVDSSHAPEGNTSHGTEEAYQIASDAAIGEDVDCPECGTTFTKRNTQHKFCCKQHRYDWHNRQNPDRQEYIQRQSNDKASDPAFTRKRFYKLIYTEVRELVLNGDIKPTVRPVTDAVTTIIKHKGHILGVKPALLGKAQRQQIAQMVLEHLEQEGIVSLNQEGGVGKPKYVLAEKYRKQILGTREKQMDLIPQEAQLV